MPEGAVPMTAVEIVKLLRDTYALRQTVRTLKLVARRSCKGAKGRSKIVKAIFFLPAH